MRKAEEEKLLADLYLQLGGSKTKRDDWITIASKAERLRQYYGSTTILAEKVGRSYALLRSILTLLQLPSGVQQLLKERKIGYDAAQRLYKLRKDPTRQEEVAKTMVEMPAHKSREIIRYAKSYPDAALGDYTRRVVGSEKKTEKIHVAIVPLGQELYRPLAELSRKEKTTVGKLIVNVLEKWLQERENK